VPTEYASPLVWGTIAVIGIATFATRLSFIALFGRIDEIPSLLGRALRYVPPAVLAALVLPAFVTLGAGSTGVAPDKLAAGAFASAVAWRTENVFATMVAGMGALWVLRFLALPAL
jgi:branched-subunit amino acid transport protein